MIIVQPNPVFRPFRNSHTSFFVCIVWSLFLAAGFWNPIFADVVSSGNTLNTSAISSWPVTVESGGTLAVNTGNIGTSTQSLTLSGTGAGTYSSGGNVYAKGAIYSNVSSGTMGMGNGIFAAVTVNGSASTLVSGGGRLRFQGTVSGGTLTTYSVESSETHAGYNSALNLEKLIVAAGNFTCNGNNGSGVYFAQNHVLTNGVEVLSGGTFRLWCMEKGVNLYRDAAKTGYAVIQLDAGGSFTSEGNITNSIRANLHAAGNSTISMNYADTNWLAGNITGASGTVLTLAGSPGFNLRLGNGVSVAADIKNTGGNTFFQNGSTLTGSLNLAGGSVTFENGSEMSGTFVRSGGTLNLNAGAVMNLSENTVLSGSYISLSGTMNVAPGKTLTLTSAGTTNSGNTGKIQLEENSQIIVSKKTSSTLNADVILQGNASIKLDADADSQKAAKLTVKNILGAGKTLTFATGNFPGGAVNADSITVGKLLMNNSSDITAGDVTGSISLYRVNVFTIGNSLTLGAEGISKSYTENSSCSLVFQNGATVGIQNGISTPVSIASSYGTYNVQLNGTLTAQTDAGETLTWKNSAFIGKAAANKLVKTGAGMLNLIPVSTSNLAGVELTDGTSNLSGTFSLSDSLKVSSGAKLSAGTDVKTCGTLKLNGDFVSAGELTVDFSANSVDKIEITGSADFTDGSRVLLNWLGGSEIPNADTNYTFFTASDGISGLDLSSIIIPDAVSGYFLGVERIGNSLSLQLNPSAVPEPAAWLLLLLGITLTGGRSFKK